MSYEQAKSLLEKYGQTQLLKYYDELNDSQKESLLKQISEIDFGLLDLVKDGESVSEKGVITPLDDAVSIKDIEENKEKGYIQPFEEVLAEIKTRDVQDSTRKIAPLQKAEDAIEIVTDSLSAKEVASFICNEIQRNT